MKTGSIARTLWRWFRIPALIAVSLCVALLLVLAADRVFGFCAGVKPPQDNGALIFPPESVNAFKTASYRYTVRCNALGLREREIEPGKSSKFRIVALGDSFTYGWGVDIEQTWLRLLEERLKPLDVETVNCGKPGEGPPYYDALAQRVIPLLRPDLVIVGILQGNDLSASWPGGDTHRYDAWRERIARFFPHFVWYLRNRGVIDTPDPFRFSPGGPSNADLDASAELNRKCNADGAKNILDSMNPEARARYDALDDEVKRHFLDGDLNPFTVGFAVGAPDAYLSILDADSSFVGECVDGLAGHLQNIRRTAERYGARVAVVILPFGMYVNTHAYETMRRLGYHVEPRILESNAPDVPIETACRRAGVPCQSATEAFRERKDAPGLYLELDEHLSPAGHELFADAVAPFVSSIVREMESARRRAR